MGDRSGVYTPSEAVDYLKRERGIIIGITTLRDYRRRGKAQAEMVTANLTLWTKQELDRIEPAKRTRRVDMTEEQQIQQVAELREKGHTWQQIATIAGYKDPSGPCTLYHRAQRRGKLNAAI